LSRLSRRRNNHWVFGHQGGVFSGNAKYLFLWISIYRPDVRATWLTDDRQTRNLIRRAGFAAHTRWSLGGVAAALRAKVFVYCHGVEDTNVHLASGAFLLNLWHGVGLKATMYGDAAGLVSRVQAYGRNWFTRQFFLEYLTPPDVVVSTSPFMQAHFAGQFRLPADRCPQLGYSRLDVCLDGPLRRSAQRIDEAEGFVFNSRAYSEVYIYMPTFRDTGRPFVSQALPDLQRLSEALRARNALLYVKLHRRTRGEEISAYDNIELWPEDVDFYTYLDRFSALITDYSSILYDYLFVRTQGAILYTFDYDQYLKSDRTLLYPFDENTAGVRVGNFDRLVEVLASGAMLGEADRALEVRSKFWGAERAPASPRILAYVEGALAAHRRNVKRALGGSTQQATGVRGTAPPRDGARPYVTERS
jgi:CDP-glycerol glycerophosphotransferase (TagB/SpsB family)